MITLPSTGNGVPFDAGCAAAGLFLAVIGCADLIAKIRLLVFCVPVYFAAANPRFRELPLLFLFLRLALTLPFRYKDTSVRPELTKIR